MASTRTLARARRVVDRLHRVLGEDVRRMREDAALTRAALAGAAGVDATYLARLEDGLVNPTLTTYTRLSTALGADLGAHLYPNTGPTIRDRHQARLLEWLLERCHPRWSRYMEVAVRQPARGWIDLVLHDRAAACVVATEIQSSLGRLEQLVRWSAAKANSLPSWDGYTNLGPIVTTSSLLLVRSTRTTRSIGLQFARQLEIADPAHPEDAIAAITRTHPWAGAALIWVDLRSDALRFVSHR
jgi:transcriptional regulator with XRE-family HTH domain